MSVVVDDDDDDICRGWPWVTFNGRFIRRPYNVFFTYNSPLHLLNSVFGSIYSMSPYLYSVIKTLFQMICICYFDCVTVRHRCWIINYFKPGAVWRYWRLCARNRNSGL